MNFHDAMETIVRVFEALGVAILALGTMLAFVNGRRNAGSGVTAPTSSGSCAATSGARSCSGSRS